MAFITHFLTKFKSSRAAVVMLLAAVLYLSVFQAAAEGISPSRAEARITDKGQLAVSSRFKTELPDQLKDVLKRGVPLDFVLSYQLEKPTLAAYRTKLNQIINNDHEIAYRLSYHPLTNRYRVSVGTFSTEYNSLNTALKGMGAIVNWQVLDAGTLSGVPAREVKAQIRLSLSVSKLPKPFQINALTSKGWQLDSGWHNLTVGN